MRHAAMALLFSGALAATAAGPALAAGQTDGARPGGFGEEVPTLTGGEVDPGSYRAGEIPAEWTRLVDDSHTISISVPAAWAAVDLAPLQNDDGTPQPWISATTDRALFFPAEGIEDTFSVPGVVYRAYPLESDTAARLEASVYHDLCVADPPQTFDDGVFVGHIQVFNSAEAPRRASSRSSPTHRSERSRRCSWSSSPASPTTRRR